MKRKRKLLSLVFLLATSTGFSQVWTFGECLEYARTHNINLKKTRLSEETAEYGLEQSKAQWEPTLDFATSQGFANNPWGDNHKNAYTSSYGLNAGWTVWDGGIRDNNIRRDKLQVEISSLTTGQALRTLETDLLQVYLNILYARESIGICEEAVKVSEAQAERSRQLMEAGRLSRVDYARLKAQYEQDRYSLVNAQTTYDSRRMELKQLLELGIGDEVTLAAVEWTDEEVTASLPPVRESLQLARITDLQLKVLDLEEKVSKLDIEIAKGGKKPKISLNAGIGTGYSAPGGAFGTSLKQNWFEQIGLSLTLPLLDARKTKTAVALARINETDARLDISRREIELEQAVENWYIDTTSAQARFEAASEQLASARLTDELTNEQFELGYVNTVELLTAHNSFTEARHTLLQAKYMAMLGKKMVEFYRDGKVTLK